MRWLMLALLIVAFLPGCVHCPSPREKTCFFIIGPDMGIGIRCLDKGEFDISEAKRGYKIFDSKEEVVDYLRGLASRAKEREI